jgi:hypothetical protein
MISKLGTVKLTFHTHFYNFIGLVNGVKILEICFLRNFQKSNEEKIMSSKIHQYFG